MRIAPTAQPLLVEQASSPMMCCSIVWHSCVMHGGTLGEVVAGVVSSACQYSLLVAGRNHSPLKSPSLPVIYFQLPTCHGALDHVSLSIRVLLFMLLVVAGDVERNPGPPKPAGLW